MSPPISDCICGAPKSSITSSTVVWPLTILLTRSSQARPAAGLGGEGAAGEQADRRYDSRRKYDASDSQIAHDFTVTEDFVAVLDGLDDPIEAFGQLPGWQAVGDIERQEKPDENADAEGVKK